MYDEHDEDITSFPVRERGLKRFAQPAHDPVHKVVPRAGTWIETILFWQEWNYYPSFPVRERGLKLLDYW